MANKKKNTDTPASETKPVAGDAGPRTVDQNGNVTSAAPAAPTKEKNANVANE